MTPIGDDNLLISIREDQNAPILQQRRRELSLCVCRVDTANTGKWVKVRMYDLSHWARLQSEVGFEWYREPGRGVKC